MKTSATFVAEAMTFTMKVSGHGALNGQITVEMTSFEYHFPRGDDGPQTTRAELSPDEAQELASWIMGYASDVVRARKLEGID